MATYVLRDAYVELAGRDISDFVSSVDLTMDVQIEDITPFNDEWAVFVAAGRKTWSVTLSIFQDFAATGGIDKYLWDRVGDLVSFALRPTQGVRGTGNPSYQGSVIVLSYPPFGNAIGEVGESLLVLRGTGELVRRV